MTQLGKDAWDACARVQMAFTMLEVLLDHEKTAGLVATGGKIALRDLAEAMDTIGKYAAVLRQRASKKLGVPFEETGYGQNDRAGQTNIGDDKPHTENERRVYQAGNGTSKV